MLIIPPAFHVERPIFPQAAFWGNFLPRPFMDINARGKKWRAIAVKIMAKSRFRFCHSRLARPQKPAYIKEMKGWIGFLAVGALLLGCAPKEIGGSSETDSPAGEAAAADQMRYPLTGAANRERVLYLYNRPEVMGAMKNWQIDRYNRLHGLAPNPEDEAYRARPKQRSPFRQ